MIHRAIICFGSVTDWFSTDIKNECANYINNDGFIPEHDYFNEDYNFFKYILEPYLQGEITMAEARHSMILSSPRWTALSNFQIPPVYYLNHVQINHGASDDTVRPAQSEALWNVLGNEYPTQTSEIHRYNGAGHVPAMNAQDQNYNYYGYDNGVIGTWLDDVMNGN